MNLVLPTTLIAVSIGTVFLYVNPQYLKLDENIAERESYIESIEKINEVEDKYQEANVWKNQIKQADIDRLEELLPETFDNVTFLLDMDRIAVENGIALSAVVISKEDRKDQDKYSTYKLAFSFDAPYSQNAMRFMRGLEGSLTLFDVEKMEVSATNKEGLIKYSFILNTYTLK